MLRDPRLGRGVGIEDSSTDIFGNAGTGDGEFLDTSTAQHADGRTRPTTPACGASSPARSRRVRSSVCGRPSTSSLTRSSTPGPATGKSSS